MCRVTIYMPSFLQSHSLLLIHSLPTTRSSPLFLLPPYASSPHLFLLLPFPSTPHSYNQILECVAVNLTLVYALLAYSGIKKKDFSNVYVRIFLEHSKRLISDLQQ